MTDNAPFRLDGRVALVTGAGSDSGIGFATARLLGRMGAAVVVTGASDRVHDRAQELRASGVDARAAVADLTVESQVAELFVEVLSMAHRLDIVVNNAGMTSVANPMETSGESGSVFDLSLADWDSAVARNLTTAFLVSKASLPALRLSGSGRIVSVTSVTGPLMAMKNDAAYAATKAGMVGLTRSLAIDEARFGITCNAVAPGWIATASQTADEAKQGLGVPVGRSATPDEVAACVAFLASTEAAYVTGQMLVVDGGNSLAEERQ
ncbi:MAG: SDR family oxidoreductase [Microbacteriaceae bacterium]|nr:SDR family oxidoreductase [Microbacteriaceae bacterium]